MTETKATVKERRRISAIWLVPIVALVLGIWMVIHTLQSQGPEITVVFSSGAGIEAAWQSGRRMAKIFGACSPSTPARPDPPGQAAAGPGAADPERTVRFIR